MSNIVELIKNNLNEKTYIKNKKDLVLYKNKTSNNEEILPNSDAAYTAIANLQTKERYNNLIVYKHHVLELRKKQAFLFGLPALFGALTISSFIYSSTDVREFDVYQKETLVFDEESIIDSSVSDVKYVYGNGNFLDEMYEDLGSINGSAKVHFGAGTDSILGQYTISNDSWSYRTYSKENYFRLDSDPKQSLGSSEKYDELIDMAADILISYIGCEDHIREVINNNKNDILVEIEKYVQIDKVDLECKSSPIILRGVLVIIDIFIAIMIGAYGNKFKKVPKLEENSGHLYEIGLLMDIKNAKLEYDEMFTKAERERITMIYEILKKHDGEYDILTTSEKKLLNIKNEGE